jgi:gliding motility-associated protein GldE
LELSIDEPPSYLLVAILAAPVIYYTVSAVVLLILLLLSALISGSEVAFFSLNHSDVEECKRSEKSSDRAIVRLVQDPKKLLATILIINNTVNVAIVTLATFVTWRITGSNTTEGKVVVLLTFIITFFIVFFGEVIPKVYASKNRLNFSRLTAKTLVVFTKLCWPVSIILMSFTNLIERKFKKKGYDISMQELNKALEMTTDQGTTDEEKEIIKGIVAFGTISVRQVMRSRIDITAVDITMDFHDLMDKVNKSGFSRIPVYKETIDRIDGILYIKDLLPYLEKDESFEWQKLLRPGYFIPENKKIDTLLRDFQDKRVHMAIVVDEYGGTSGLITLEDVIEEIVGEINDEFDEEDIHYNKLDDKTYVFEGKTSLNDFCKITNTDPHIFEEVKGESESIGGLILEIHSRLPNAGEKITFDKFVFTIVAVDQRRIKRVRVFINESTIDGEKRVASAH